MCNYCGNLFDLNICTRCRHVYYCNPSCQEVDYPDHKTMCIEIKQTVDKLSGWGIINNFNLGDFKGLMFFIHNTKDFISILDGKNIKHDKIYDLIKIEHEDPDEEIIDTIKEHDVKSATKVSKILKLGNEKFVMIILPEYNYTHVITI